MRASKRKFKYWTIQEQTSVAMLHPKYLSAEEREAEYRSYHELNRIKRRIARYQLYGAERAVLIAKQLSHRGNDDKRSYRRRPAFCDFLFS